MDKKSKKVKPKKLNVSGPRKSKDFLGKEEDCDCGSECACSSEPPKKKNICDIYGNCS
jgi:hypothetical protein